MVCDSSGLVNGTLQVGANKEKSVTKVATMGLWVPVHVDEWDGEMPLEIGTPVVSSQSGEVVFKGGALPWKAGTYEVRQFWMMKLFFPIRLGLDPLSPRWEIQRYGHRRSDRSIRWVFVSRRISTDT